MDQFLRIIQTNKKVPDISQAPHPSRVDPDQETGDYKDRYEDHMSCNHASIGP
jgi:hypothetical protein